MLMWATGYGQHDLMRECMRTNYVNDKTVNGNSAIHFVLDINEKCTEFVSVE
jgi:hypothetical protein